MNTIQSAYNTSFQKKEVINAILSSELGSCKHRINARYEWKRSDQVFTFCLLPKPKNTLEIRINLNIGRQNHLTTVVGEPMLEMIYRAYYISAYIRYLDDAATFKPQSYFSGLVLLCAINSLCTGKKVRVFSPIERKPDELRPIDVYCAIRALTRLTIDCSKRISEQSRNDINEVISELLTYSMLPEISYKGNEAFYSVLQEVKELWENMKSHKCFMEDYSFFDELDSRRICDLSVNELVVICENIRNPFWGNFVIRLLAHLGVCKDIVLDKESFITTCIRHLGEDSVKYYREIKQTENRLLIDNFMAIKYLSRMSEQAFSIVTANAGQIHYFQ